jgi:hypothetical protein
MRGYSEHSHPDLLKRLVDLSPPVQLPHMVIPHYFGGTFNIPTVRAQQAVIAKQLDGILFRVRNQYGEAELACACPDFLIALDSGGLAQFLTSLFVLISGDGYPRPILELLICYLLFAQRPAPRVVRSAAPPTPTPNYRDKRPRSSR